MSKFIKTFVVLALIAVGVAAGVMGLLPDYGTKLEFNGGELFYTDTVTAEEADKLGAYLVEISVFNGEEKSVQVDKRDDTYCVRMIIKNNMMDDREVHAGLRIIGKDICNKVFGGAPTEMHMTDDEFETVNVLTVTQSYGELLKFKTSELYYTPAVTREEAEALGKFLVEIDFFDDNPRTIQLNKNNGIYEFRFVGKIDFEMDIVQTVDFRGFAKRLSEKVFEKKPVDIHVTDASLFTLKIATSTGDSDRELAVNGSSSPFSLLTNEMMMQIGKDLADEQFN